MDNQNYQVIKSSIDVYKFRHPSGMYWADIAIDAAGETGRISIASDFGDWSNYWGSCGMPFKDFLCMIDKWYAANKFGANTWFDQEKTIAGLKEEVDRQLSNEEITPDMAEEIRDELEVLSDFNSKDAFAVQCFNTEHLHQLWDCGPDLITDIEPSFNHFWDKVWPVMIQTFKEEKEVSNG